MKTLNTMEKAEIPAQALLRFVAKKPGLKDTNFQVRRKPIIIVGDRYYCRH